MDLARRGGCILDELSCLYLLLSGILNLVQAWVIPLYLPKGRDQLPGCWGQGGGWGGVRGGGVQGAWFLLTFRESFLSWQGPALLKRASAPLPHQAAGAWLAVSRRGKTFSIISGGEFLNHRAAEDIKKQLVL